LTSEGDGSKDDDDDDDDDVGCPARIFMTVVVPIPAMQTVSTSPGDKHLTPSPNLRAS